MKSLMVIVSSTSLILSPLAGAVEGGSVSPPAETLQPEVTSAEELGFEIIGDVDWRIEQNADGDSIVIYGPGTSSTELRDDTVRISSNIEPNQSVPTESTAAAARWVCAYADGRAISKSGSSLRSYVGNSCTNRPGQMRLEWWFDRKAAIGWRQYTSEHRYTSWTSAQAIGTDVYAYCGSGSTHTYRARMKANFRNTGAVGGIVIASSAEGKFSCGTKEL
ncbi:MAG: hypothetical protein Q4G43_11280 [Mobilicoccus sp.]|nr:hypothetical protein [Mobilicoccus sp.]